MDAIVWRVEQTAEDRLILYRRSRQRKAKKILGEGCGALKDIGRRMWRTEWTQLSGELNKQQKIG